MKYFVWSVDPDIFSLGFLHMRWYGFLAVLSFIIGFYIMQWIFTREKVSTKNLELLPIYIMIGAIVGARLAHCFIYNPQYYLNNLVEVLLFFKGGLASHGGVVGVLIAIYVYAKKYNIPYGWLLSRITIPAAITGTFFRFGNFFNSEIYGLPSDLPIAIVFLHVDNIPRHPTQLYEAFTYLLIAFLLFVIYLKIKPIYSTKILSGMFLFSVFTSRFLLEFTKTKQVLYSFDGYLTMGQILSIPFIIIGILLIAFPNRKQND